MTDKSQVKISQLPTSTDLGINDSDIMVASRIVDENKLETQRLTVSELRRLMDYGNAFTDLNAAIAATVKDQQFYVFVDDTKEYVYRYVNLGGIGSPVLDMDGKAVREPTKELIRHLDQVRAVDGFGVVGAVESFDVLRNLTPKKEGWRVQLIGYYAGSSLGGGIFVAKKGTQVDDGGMVAVVDSDYAWVRDTGNVITPEMFGAKGDRLAIDNGPIEKAIRYASSNGTKSNPIEIKLLNKYRVSKGFDLGSFTTLSGPGEIFIDSTDLTLIFLTATDKESITIKDLSITRAVAKPADMWSKGATGIQVLRIKDLVISGNDLSYHTDAISVSNSDRVLIENNRTHELGEEGVAIRSSRNFIVRGNHVYHHHGDGILMKTGSIECHDGQIVDNFVYDGLLDSVAAAGQQGGGITLNDENVDGAGGSSTTMDGLIVSRNNCRNVSYGIAFNNLTSAVIQGNIISSVSRFGLVIDTTPFNNPALNPVLRFTVTGNILRDVGERGIGFRSDKGIVVDYVSITGNVLDNCGYKTNGDFPSIDVGTGTITGNTVLNSRVAIMATDNALVTGNQFVNSKYDAAGANSVWIKLSGAAVFTNNLVKDSKMGHIRFTATNGMIFANNHVETSSTFAVLSFITAGLPYGRSIFKDNIYIYSANAICNFTIGADSIRALGLSRAEFGAKDYFYDATLSTLVSYKKGDRVSLLAPESGASSYAIVDDNGRKAATEFIPYYAKTAQFNQTIGANSTAIITIADPNVKGNWSVGKVWCSVSRNGAMIQCDCTKDGEVTVRFVNATGSSISINGAVVTVECFAPPSI